MPRIPFKQYLRRALGMRQRRHRLHTDACAGRVVHCMKEPYDVYIGRPSKWGNPFRLSGGANGRVLALEAYRKWLRERPDLLEDAQHEILGKTLGCWCAPHNICHGHVLLHEAAHFAKSKYGT